MDAFKVGILEPSHFSPKALTELEKIGSVELFSETSSVESFVADKDILFIRLKHLIDDDLILHAPKLKYICSPTTGLNHIQVTRPVKVISLKGEETFLNTIRATPEHVFGLTLALLRNYRQAFLSQSQAEWNREKYTGYEIYGNTVGIIGLGRVGKILAGYFQAFSATVHYFEVKNDVVAAGGLVREPSISSLIENSKIIILAADYRSENHQFFDKKYFDLLEGKYFINAARGELINEQDLLAFINRGNYEGVAIDVLANEPEGPPVLEALLQAAEHKHVVITPHIGGATYTSMARTEEFIVEKLLRDLIR